MKTVFDIWKRFPAIKAEADALWAKAAQRLITEGHVAMLDGEIVEIRMTETQKAPIDPT